MVDYWLNIEEAPGYEVSNTGKVRNIKTHRVLKPYLDRPNGYERVELNGKHHYVHKLVANRFFASDVDKTKKVVHIDGNKRNNFLANLEIRDRK